VLSIADTIEDESLFAVSAVSRFLYMKKIDVRSGDRYGLLTVLDCPYLIIKGKRVVSCVCACGVKKEYGLSSIRTGKTKSCGCLLKKTLVARNRAMATHGHSGQKRTGTYRSWLSMLGRCANPNSPGYVNYGGRGISVCNRWRTFENFLLDMGERPEHTSLDRINENGNYCKSNCRWATNIQQGEHKRSNVYVTYKGKTQHLSAWARELSIKVTTLHMRIFTRGWSVQKSFSTPTHRGTIKPDNHATCEV